MKRLLKNLNSAYILILITLTVIVTLLGIYQVVARYFLKWPITWTEETMRYLYVSIVMLGVGLVTKTESFATITYLSDLVDRKSKMGGKILGLFQNFVQVIFFTLLFYYGTKLSIQAINTLTPTTKISFFIVYLPLPLGGLMGLAFALIKLIIFLRQPYQAKREVI